MSDDARLLILGGVENGRGGMLSLASKTDGDPHLRSAIGAMSGISSGTPGDAGSCFVPLPAARRVCACGKYDARGVEVGEEAASIGVFMSSVPLEQALVRVRERVNVTQRTIPWVSIRAVVTFWASSILVARAGFPFRASQWA